MTTIWTWLAGKAWWLIVVAALCMVILGQRAQVSNAKAATARVQAELANTKTTYAQAAERASKAARAEETRREAAKQEVIDHAKQETKLAQDAARDAGDAADRLRGRVAALVTAARASTGNPTAGGRSAPADAPAVLADLLGRIDDAAGKYAAAADQSRVAGQACERQYDALQPAAGP